VHHSKSSVVVLDQKCRWTGGRRLPIDVWTKVKWHWLHCGVHKSGNGTVALISKDMKEDKPYVHPVGGGGVPPGTTCHAQHEQNIRRPIHPSGCVSLVPYAWNGSV